MKIGATDEFENLYMTKFRLLAAPYGVFVEYERDRAGRDIGLHLTQPAASSGGKIVTPALVWFQMKGLMKQTFSSLQYRKAKDVSIVLETAHLRFWYISPQPTYLALYIESKNLFLGIDIQKWVKQNFGIDILSHPNKTITVKVDKKNILDDEFFRIVLEVNLVTALRNVFSEENEKDIRRFLRDSSLVKWLSIVADVPTSARIRVISWITKMRTEVYFEAQNEEGDWVAIRNHWQFAMGEITEAFPFLTMKPKRRAIEEESTEFIDTEQGYDEYKTTKISLVEEDDDDWWDDEDFEGECLLSIGGNEYSYGEMAGGEYVEHEIAITLNDIGQRWAVTLRALEAAEIISIDTAPHYVSVAPWHARDV